MTRSLLFAALALALSTSSMAQTMQRSGSLSRADRVSPSTQLGVQTGTVTTGSISGRAGTATETLMPGEDAILTGLLLGEKNGRVCYVQAEFWRKGTPGAARRVVRRRFDQCRPQIGRNPQVGQVLFHRLGLNGGAYTDDSFRVAQGLQTCTTGSGAHIDDRSLLMYEGDVDADGTISTRNDIIAAIRAGRSTRCTQNLNDAVMCPSGQVVVGVDVRYRPSPGRNAVVVGLAPKCAPITVTSGPALSTSN